jgi:hypothetical protein
MRGPLHGSKHMEHRARSGDPNTGITSGSVEIRVPAIVMIKPPGEEPRVLPSGPGSVLHSFAVKSGGDTFDVLVLAKTAVDQWTAFLSGRGFL